MSNPFDAPEKQGAAQFYYRLTVKRDKASRPDTPVFQLSEKRGDEYAIVKEQREIAGRVVGASFKEPVSIDQTGIVSLSLAANDLADSPIAVVSMGAGSRFGKDAMTFLAREQDGILGKKIRIVLWDIADPNKPKDPKKFGWAVYDQEGKLDAEGKRPRIKTTDTEFAKAANAAEQRLLGKWWNNVIKPKLDFYSRTLTSHKSTVAANDYDTFEEEVADTRPAPVDDLPF